MVQITLSTIKSWLENEYDSFQCRVHLYENYVYWEQNGGSNYAHIKIEGNKIVIDGERFGKSVSTECSGSEEDLVRTMRAIF